MDMLAAPFLLFLWEKIDRAFPPLVVRSLFVIAGVSAKRGGRLLARNPSPQKILKDISLLKTDEQFSEYLLRRAKIHDVWQMYLIAIQTRNVLADLGTQNKHYEWMKKKLGKTPSALSIVRLGLELAMNFDVAYSSSKNPAIIGLVKKRKKK